MRQVPQQPIANWGQFPSGQSLTPEVSAAKLEVLSGLSSVSPLPGWRGPISVGSTCPSVLPLCIVCAISHCIFTKLQVMGLGALSTFPVEAVSLGRNGCKICCDDQRTRGDVTLQASDQSFPLLPPLATHPFSLLLVLLLAS